MQTPIRRPAKRWRRWLGLIIALLGIALLGLFFLPGTSLWPGQEEGPSPMLLVNAVNPLPNGYVPKTLTEPAVRFAPGVAGERRKLCADAARALERLFEGADAQGIELYAVSGYRSYATQQEIYSRRLAESGAQHVSRYIALPGASEHQSGLAMDVNCKSLLQDGLVEAFADTTEGKWLAAHAQDYGFIVRYPADGEDKTGIAYEPWHIRYVGEEAPAVAASGKVLEEYVEDE